MPKSILIGLIFGSFCDIATMKQPSFIKNFDDWENFSVYNLSVNWGLDN